MAIETQSGVCKQEQSSNQHTVHAQSAGPLQGCTHQQRKLQVSALSSSTLAQGCCMHAVSLHAAPPAPVFPLHQGSVQQQPCPQGTPLQPCEGQVPAAVRPSKAQTTPPLIPPSVPQQLEDEEVCCDQPALPLALPPQQLATRGDEHRDVQAALSNTGLPADRTSSNGKAGNKADHTRHATVARKPAKHGAMQKAPGAGPSASGGTLPAQNPGQEQPRGIDSSAAPDKENAGTGRMLFVVNLAYE